MLRDNEMQSDNLGSAAFFLFSDSPGAAPFFIFLFVGPTILVQVLTVFVVGRFRLAGALLLILASLVVNIALWTLTYFFLPTGNGGVWVFMVIWVASICLPWFLLPLDRLRSSD